MYLIDTDVIIEFLRGDKSIVQRFTRNRNYNFSITSLSLCELYKGAFLANDPDKERANIRQLLINTSMLALDAQSCKTFGQKYSSLKAAGKPAQEIDLMIASIAITNKLTLVTRNKEHFQNIQGLNIEEW